MGSGCSSCALSGNKIDIVPTELVTVTSEHAGCPKCGNGEICSVYSDCNTVHCSNNSCMEVYYWTFSCNDNDKPGHSIDCEYFYKNSLHPTPGTHVKDTDTLYHNIGTCVPRSVQGHDPCCKADHSEIARCKDDSSLYDSDFEYN